jgi:hypothetical protein
MSDFLLDDIDFNDFLATDGEFNDCVDILIAEAAAELDQPAPAPALTSAPLYTVELGELTMTVIRVDHNGRDTYQVYAVGDETWSMVALFGLFVDALAEIRTWRRYLFAGGSLQTWMARHPHGITPDASAVVAS